MKEISRPHPGGREKEAHPNNYRVMVSLQRGARYELEERLVRKVVRMIVAWGFIDLQTN